MTLIIKKGSTSCRCFASLCFQWYFPISRSLSAFSRLGRQSRGNEHCAQIAETWKSGAVGQILTGPFSLVRTATVWSPSHSSSRLSLISPCASQSMPLMWWCPSFTYSIFDLFHFLQPNLVGVFTKGYLLFSPSSHSFSPMFSKMITKLTTKIYIYILSAM